MNLSQLACDDCIALAQDFTRVAQRGGNAMRGFIKNESCRKLAQLSQARAPFSRTRRQKARKKEFVGRQSRSYQRRDQRSRSRQSNHRYVLCACLTDEAKTGVADARR